MIISLVTCPNCEIGILNIPLGYDFYFSRCRFCKEMCVYLTKRKEEEYKKLASKLPNFSFEEWLEKLKKNNVKVKYIKEVKMK